VTNGIEDVCLEPLFVNYSLLILVLFSIIKHMVLSLVEKNDFVLVGLTSECLLYIVDSSCSYSGLNYS
jgi:hypothetical protein